MPWWVGVGIGVLTGGLGFFLWLAWYLRDVYR